MDKVKDSIDMWKKIPDVEKKADIVVRPSLTYWQDVFNRLKQNKIAIMSFVIILVILLSAIFIPLFWRYNYEEQILEFSNIPPVLDIYDLNNGQYIYVTKDYKVVLVSQDGHLLQAGNLVKDDKDGRKVYYKIDEKILNVDYSPYFEAKKEHMILSRKYKGGDILSSKEANYIVEYFNKKGDSLENITFDDATWILENGIQRYEVIWDNSKIDVAFSKLNKTFILGSDNLGRDIFVRILYGARISLIIGFAAAFVNFFIGVVYGGIAGYFGGKVDSVMMRIVEVISSIPMMLYVILLMVVMKPGLLTIILALSITYWVTMARIVRGQILSLKEQEFVLAAKTIGADTIRILSTHLLPNIIGPIMVALTMQIPSAIFTESFLSFVGLGVAAPKASWGTLCSNALAGLYTFPYQMFFPAIAISVTILAFNLFGDGLRDALDPKLRK